MGVFVTFHDGAHWQSLQLNLPRSSARDLVVHGNDLAVATHGRSFWVLDNLSPLRQLTDAARREPVHLFTPDTAIRWDGGRARRSVAAGQNPASGVTVDYLFRVKPRGTVTLAFLDASGKVIRTFSSKGAPSEDSASADSANKSAKDSTEKAQHDTTATRGRKKKIEAADSVSYAPSDSLVSTRAGMNRFVWNLRYEDVKHIDDILIDYGTISGPMVQPGSYSVRLTADGKSFTQPFVVVNDPRTRVSAADLQAQANTWFQLRDKLDSTVTSAKHIETMEKQLDARVEQVKKQPYSSRVSAAATPLRAKLEAIRAELVEVHSHADEITLHFQVKIYNKMLTLNVQLLTGDNAPTQSQLESLKDLTAQLDTQLQKLRALESGDVGAFNRLMKELDVPAVSVKSSKVVM
jgi:hypothetical protein